MRGKQWRGSTGPGVMEKAVWSALTPHLRQGFRLRQGSGGQVGGQAALSPRLTITHNFVVVYVQCKLVLLRYLYSLEGCLITHPSAR